MSNGNHPWFLQIHTLTSYPAALLNRDDMGLSKRIPFGGASRTRISSQCLKRHWRTFEGQNSLADATGSDGQLVPLSVRSRRTFEVQVKDPLVADGVSEERAVAVTEALIAEVLQKSETRSKKDDDEALRTGQVVVLGRPEVDYFLSIAQDVLSDADDPKEIKKAVKERFKKDGGKNLKTLLNAGLDSAMFGRMVTSDVLSRCDAALHVAHAFTVHAEAAEDDYFSAVDDLMREVGETGSGHINSTELTSGLYYSYVVVDVPLLVSNLTGHPQADWQNADPKLTELAQDVVRRMVHLIATVSPGAKLGSTAPYAYAHMVMVESGSESPRTLANAFMNPVRADEGQLLEATYRALGGHLGELDDNYGKPSGGRYALALGSRDDLAAAMDDFKPLGELATWAGEQVTA